MEHRIFLISFICLLSAAVLSTAEASDDHGNIGFREREQHGKVKLFVFGDSYADTGNLPSSVSKSWKTPYGITFPGKPSGRFSDGRVLTDYIASYLGIRSPLPYQLMKNFNTKTWTRHGINFAHGGTGVFTTLVDQPNMTTQIDFFQQLIDKNVYTTLDLSSSIALVSLAGNDYAAYLAKTRSFEGLPGFTRSVINQFILNVRRINGFGIKKIAITGLEPVGCLPQNTASDSYENCNAAQNNFSQSHNQLLKQNIWALNSEAAAPVFIYLDLYTAFFSVLEIGQNPAGWVQQPSMLEYVEVVNHSKQIFDEIGVNYLVSIGSKGNISKKLKPCCVGDCGLVDKNGKKKYVVCGNPNHSVFWDSIHPSNAGWAAVYSALKRSLHSLLL